MPVWCSVPGCLKYKKAQAQGVKFHKLPVKDIPRCRQWLAAIKNVAYDVNTPVEKYQNICVCSQHFRPDDYERELRMELTGTPARRKLKCDAIPSIFSFTNKIRPSNKQTPTQEKRQRKHHTPGGEEQPTATEELSSIFATVPQFPVRSSTAEESHGDTAGSRSQLTLHQTNPWLDVGPAKNYVSQKAVDANEDVCVNVGCLLQLFQTCGKCRGKCVVTTQRKDARRVTVCQWCAICNQLATWNSQPTPPPGAPQGVLPDSAAISKGACGGKGKPLAELEVTVDFESSRAESTSSGAGEMTQEDFDNGDAEDGSKSEDEVEDEEEEDDDDDDDDSGVLDERLGTGELEQRFDLGKEEEDLKVQREEEAAKEELKTEDEENDWAEKEHVDDADEDWCMDEDEFETEDDSQDESDCHNEIQRKCGQPRKLDKVRQSTSTELCPTCGVIFTRRHKCKPDHVFPCSDCGKYFGSESSVTTHKIVCNVREGRNRCVYCFEVFNTRLDTKQHELSHSKTERPYGCSECPQRFKDLSTRRRHLKEHNTKCVCPTCHKEFPSRYYLMRHVVTHENEKPFKCQLCGRSFAQASQLKSHLRVHTGERPFQCSLCPMSFNHNVSKKNHMRSHNNESQPSPPAAVD